MDRTAMMKLIDMLETHIDKHKENAGRFDTGAMIAKNYAIALLNEERDQILEAHEDGFFSGQMIVPDGESRHASALRYYEKTFKSEL